jgi:hypothetical protein
VLDIVGKVRQWWAKRPPTPSAGVPFAVACVCGHVVHGLRQPRHQVLRCPGCRQPVFVLPLSPLPVVEPTDPLRPVQRSAPALPGASPTWRLPLLAGGLTLAAVALVFVVLFLSLDRREPEDRTPTDARVIRDHIRASRRALAEGNHHLALEELKTALKFLVPSPHLLSPPESRQLTALYRQAELLTDLLSEPLEQILDWAAEVRDDQERQAQFARRYQGKAVVFDDVIRREGGQCRLQVYELRVKGERARVELGDLKLMAALPLDQPQRVLFGARLAGVAREPPGDWVVRFDPDSGVLLTDVDAAASCCPAPLDPELLALVKRQAEWLGHGP